MIDQILPSLTSFGIGVASTDKTRSRIWLLVHTRITTTSIRYEYEYEMALVLQLMEGQRWGDMVPREWKDIYGAMFDESLKFPIDERERINISKDVNRTFGAFTRNRLMQIQFRLNDVKYSESLKAVLLASSHERRYCQGFNFLAALFILNESSDKESFILLCFLLRQRHLEILFNPACSSLLEYMKVFEKRLRSNNRNVFRHFRSIGFDTICYAIEWFTTCFIVSSPSSGELSSCVVDMLLLGFTDPLLRVGLAVLDCLEPYMLTLTLEDLQLQFKTLTRQVDVIDVLTRALSLECVGGAVCSAIRSNQTSPDSDTSAVPSPRIDGCSTPSGSPSNSSFSTPHSHALPLPREDILLAMARNIEQMEPSALGEFLHTIPDTYWNLYALDEADFRKAYGEGSGSRGRNGAKDEDEGPSDSLEESEIGIVKKPSQCEYFSHSRNSFDSVSTDGDEFLYEQDRPNSQEFEEGEILKALSASADCVSANVDIAASSRADVASAHNPPWILGALISVLTFGFVRPGASPTTPI